MQIRAYGRDDWEPVWAMLEPVFRAGETYAVACDITVSEARALWTAAPRAVFVAADDTGHALLGTYFIKPNFDGPGAHVCNAGYVVAERARGQGVAARLCEHSQAQARERGFLAMQYNLVVSTNQVAVRVWQRMGFQIVGTVPDAFRHPRLGLVDTFVMHKKLGPG